MEDNIGSVWAVVRNHSAEIAAVMGSVTSAYFTELKTWRERFASAVLGVPAAIFGGEFLFWVFPQLGENLCGYLMGFFGLNICAAWLKSIRRFGDDADFWVLFKELVTRIYERYIPVSRTDESGKD